MEPQIFFILIFMLIVLLIIIYSAIHAMKRAKELQEWGLRMGLRYTNKERSMDDAFPQFSCLHHGHSRYAKNVLTGKLQEFPVCLFDYHYTTGSGKNQQHHSFSALMINIGLPLKSLYIRKETFLDKVTEFVGFDDIDFESAEFSREFYVKSPDKRWAYDVLHQKTMEYLLSAPRFTLDFQGPYIMAYRDATFSIPDFEDAFSVLKEIYTLFPEYLLRELKGEK